MKLQELFKGVGRILSWGGPISGQSPDSQQNSLQEVQSLFFDARQVGPHSVFIALKGTKQDGHDFLQQAAQNGAIALVVSDPEKVPGDFQGVVLVVPDGRAALDEMAARFFGYPGRELFCVGVTGTNGKTSTTYMIEHLLNSAKIPTGVIGTINHHLQDKIWSSEMTTPDPVSLQARLHDFLNLGAQAVAMEVSSHALAQHRADSVPFDVCLFTNLTRDHLDYHQTMDEYFKAKELLFSKVLAQSSKSKRFALIHEDQEWAAKVKLPQPITRWTYGNKESCDFQYTIKEMKIRSTCFLLRTSFGVGDFVLPMVGDHNVQNAVAAIATCLAKGLKFSELQKFLPFFPGVPGRMQLVRSVQSREILIDYAHTPDALQNVLKTVQEVRNAHAPQSQIWLVMGCGGDRDKGKRPQMAKTAEKFADRTVVTSDNPRGENPQQIIEDILVGFSSQQNIFVEIDRDKAIHLALKKSRMGDIILVAGKGHENYQIIGSQKLHFDDYEVAEQKAKQEGIS